MLENIIYFFLQIILGVIGIGAVVSAFYLVFSLSKGVMKNKVGIPKADVERHILQDDLKQYFVEGNETLEAITGTKLVKQYKGKGTVKQAFAFVTDLRVYVLGKHKKNKKRTVENDSVEIVKVTELILSETRKKSWLIIMATKTFIMLLPIYFYIIAQDSKSWISRLADESLKWDRGIMWTAIIIFMVLMGTIVLLTIPGIISLFYDGHKYLTDKEIRLTIYHTEGVLNLAYSWLNKEETETFISTVRKLNNVARKNIGVQEVYTETALTDKPVMNNKSVRLTELYKMLKDGVLTEEEFEKLKSEVME